jgi:gliding motility-associated-like protein
VPNAFTPGKDGKNDVFRALLFGDVRGFSFTVYNRWGEIVFHSKERTKGWDGNYKGKPQDANMFVWVCRYQLEGEVEQMEKGTVMLMR